MRGCTGGWGRDAARNGLTLATVVLHTTLITTRRDDSFASYAHVFASGREPNGRPAVAGGVELRRGHPHLPLDLLVLQDHPEPVLDRAGDPGRVAGAGAAHGRGHPGVVRRGLLRDGQQAPLQGGVRDGQGGLLV